MEERNKKKNSWPKIIWGIIILCTSYLVVMSEPKGTQRAGLAIFLAFIFIAGYEYGRNAEET